MQTYTIKEAAILTQLAPSTLRYYERIGLLDYVGRDEAGNRAFTRADLGTLHTIDCLKETGMPLADIRHYLELVPQGMASVSERKQIMAAQQKRLAAKLAKLRAAEDTISFKLNYYTKAEQTGSFGACHDDREEFYRRLFGEDVTD